MDVVMVPHKGDMKINEVLGRRIFFNWQVEFQNTSISNENTFMAREEKFFNTKVVCVELRNIQKMRVVGVCNLNFKTKAF